MAVSETLNLVDASIADLKLALESRSLTSVELVSLYLHRIGKYDMRGPSLNSVCIINPNIFEEAQASDDYRASGRPPRALEGIPFTVKDSFKVEGMTVSAGSPAFEGLKASDDSAVVEALRAAGAIVLGRTNMPAMADGGAQRGLYGRAESPYNPIYSTTALASGSSNGCGTSTAASFAAFGLAGETVSSGRAPASNNALVGYSPSRAMIPIRGQWPLYPTCDVVVPHTRTMKDMFDVLNVIFADDEKSSHGCDFWMNQPFVKLPKASEIRPTNFHDLADPGALRGKVIAVPTCFLGRKDAVARSFCSDAVLSLFERALETLKKLGASIQETDFPLLEQYTKKDFPGQASNVPGMDPSWITTERCDMIALGWDDFLRQNQDKVFRSLTHADPEKIKPYVAPLDDPSAHSEAQNQVRYSDMYDVVRKRDKTLFTLPDCAKSLQALEMMRVEMLEGWMKDHGYDLIAFPTNGDVSLADADENLESMLHALQDGIKYSNGGRAMKHLGVPCVTVPMGIIPDKGMPVGITFACQGWRDADLLRYAFAYENHSKQRTNPPMAPPLRSDSVRLYGDRSIYNHSAEAKPILKIESTNWERDESATSEACRIYMCGTVEASCPEIGVQSVQAFVDGEPREGVAIDGCKWSFETCATRPKKEERYPPQAAVPMQQFLVTIVARGVNGRSAAEFCLIP